MIIKNNNDYFKILNLPKSFFLDKNVLKDNYYSISKKYHPDIAVEKNNEMSHILNKAYSILNDDFSRAKLFTVPSENVEPEFLEKCIELEDRIRKGEDLTKLLEKKIEECKKNYLNKEYVTKWGYYKRLYDLNKQ